MRRKALDTIGHELELRIIDYVPLGGGSARITSDVVRIVRGNQRAAHDAIAATIERRPPLQQRYTSMGIYPYYSVDVRCIYGDRGEVVELVVVDK